MTFKILFMQTYSETSYIIWEYDDREELCKFLCNRFSTHYITRRQNFNKIILCYQNKLCVCRHILWIFFLKYITEMNFSVLGMFGILNDINKKLSYYQEFCASFNWIFCLSYLSSNHSNMIQQQKSFFHFISEGGNKGYYCVISENKWTSPKLLTIFCVNNWQNKIRKVQQSFYRSSSTELLSFITKSWSKKHSRHFPLNLVTST